MAIKKAIFAVLSAFILALFSALAQQANSTSCGYVNNDLTLASDISSTGTCFIFNASNIALNCAGFTIRGNQSGDGIFAENLTTITTKNCNVEKFENGIYLSSTNKSILTNNIVQQTVRGIYLIASINTNITSNTAFNSSSIGFAASLNSDHNVFSSNTANSSQTGFLLSVSTNNSLQSNTALNNPQKAFSIVSGTATVLASNTGSNSQYGFYLESSTNNNLVGNIATNNSQAGFYMFISADNNILTSNSAVNNSLYGFILGASSGNNFTSNNASGSQYGFALATSSANNEMSFNTIFNNSLYGIYLTPGINNTITQNTISNNSMAGIYLDGNSHSNMLFSNILSAHLSGIAASIYLLGVKNNTIINNTVTSSTVGIQFVSSAENNYLINNNLSSGINDETGDEYVNYLVYNNSLGEIQWTDSGTGSFLRNLTIQSPLGHGANLFIGNNIAALNTSAFAGSKINSSANITLRELDLSVVTEIKKADSFTTESIDIVNNGVNCNGTSCLIISYNSSTKILFFNTSSFSSFAANGSGEVDVYNISLLHTNSSGYAAFRFFMKNLLSTANIFNWTFNTAENAIKNSMQINLAGNKEVFVFIEHDYAVNGTYTVMANGTTTNDEDIEIKNVTVG